MVFVSLKPYDALYRETAIHQVKVAANVDGFGHEHERGAAIPGDICRLANLIITLERADGKYSEIFAIFFWPLNRFSSSGRWFLGSQWPTSSQ